MISESLHFVFDSDSLIQVLLTDFYKIFNILREDFAIESYIMSEVDVEVRSNKKFGSLVRPKLG